MPEEAACQPHLPARKESPEHMDGGKNQMREMRLCAHVGALQRYFLYALHRPCGQRGLSRLRLCMLMDEKINLLILDEPTNHLDSDMILWLEDHLRKFTGGLIMVTHDRYFLERVVNRITELAHCRIRHYEANYSKYLALKTQQEEMEQAAQLSVPLIAEAHSGKNWLAAKE